MYIGLPDVVDNHNLEILQQYVDLGFIFNDTISLTVTDYHGHLKGLKKFVETLVRAREFQKN